MTRSTKLLPAVFLLLALPVIAEDAAMNDHPVPATTTTPATATFSMFCYWTGEAALGQVDGVLASRIGHWGGEEVVQVDYDPARTDLGELVHALRGKRSFDAVVVSDQEGRKATRRELGDGSVIVRRGSPRFIEPKHSLRVRHPELLRLGLSEQQAIALNAWSHYGGPMPNVLTAEQRSRLDAERER